MPGGTNLARKQMAVRFLRLRRTICLEHTEMHMRSLISSVLLLLGFLLVSPPQSAQAQEIGILGGLTFSDITGDEADEDLDRSMGFLGGAFFRMPLGSIITFQPEVQYVRKGAEGDFTGGDAAVKLSYIDVPLFLSFGVPGNAFHVLVGPTLSFEVGCEVDIDTAAVEFEGDCDDGDEFDEERKSFITGLTVGGGLDLPLGGLSLMIDGRYGIDLESFAENENIDTKNQVFEIIAGIRFPLGG